jgi:hypothetical protein
MQVQLPEKTTTSMFVTPRKGLSIIQFESFFDFSIKNLDFHPYLKRKQIIDEIKKLCKQQVLPVDVQNSETIPEDQYNQLIKNCVPNGVVWRFNNLYFRISYGMDPCTYILNCITEIVEEYMKTQNQDSALKLLEDLSQKIVSIWNDFYSSDQNWKIDDHTGNALHDLSEIVFTKLDRPFPIYLGTSSCFDRTVNKHRTYHIFVDSTTGCIIIREYKKNDNEQNTKGHIFIQIILSSIAEDSYHPNRKELNYFKKTLDVLFESYKIKDKLPEYLDKFLEYGVLLMNNIGNHNNVFSIKLKLYLLCEDVVNRHVEVDIIDFLWRNPLP